MEELVSPTMSSETSRSSTQSRNLMKAPLKASIWSLGRWVFSCVKM